MKNLGSLILVLSFLSVAIACSGRQPAPPNLDNTTWVYYADFDDVWEGVIDVLSEFMSPIEAMEKESGLITTDWGRADQVYADCGGTTYGEPKEKYLLGRYNVFVREAAAPGEIEVRVNTAWKGDDPSLLCNTTGRFEELFHAMLQSNVTSGQ